MIWISKRKLESKRKIDDKYFPNSFYTIIIPEIVKEASNHQREKASKMKKNIRKIFMRKDVKRFGDYHRDLWIIKRRKRRRIEKENKKKKLEKEENIEMKFIIKNIVHESEGYVFKPSRCGRQEKKELKMK
jgi:hypothetical protein